MDFALMWGFKNVQLDPRYAYVRWEHTTEVTNAIGEVKKTNVELQQENCTRYDPNPNKRIQDFTKKFKCSHENPGMVLEGSQNTDVV